MSGTVALVLTCDLSLLRSLDLAVQLHILLVKPLCHHKRQPDVEHQESGHDEGHLIDRTDDRQVTKVQVCQRYRRIHDRENQRDAIVSGHDEHI